MVIGLIENYGFDSSGQLEYDQTMQSRYGGEYGKGNTRIMSNKEHAYVILNSSLNKIPEQFR